jgi:hypothetical protein
MMTLHFTAHIAFAVNVIEPKVVYPAMLEHAEYRVP